jgi:hypothetical protein
MSPGRNHHGLTWAAAALAVLAAGALNGCDRSSGPPRPESVDPASGPEDRETPITIHGTDFFVSAQVNYGRGDPAVDGRFTATLGGHALIGMQYVDSSTLRAVVPAGLSPGKLDLVVTDPLGRQGTLRAAFQVGAGGDGGSDQDLSGSDTPVGVDVDGGDGGDGQGDGATDGPDGAPGDGGDGGPADGGDGGDAGGPALVARLVVNPPAGSPGTYQADASSSTGTGLSFAFDLDGDGVFETIPASGASVPLNLTTAGDYVVAVQVTDSSGRVAYARRTVVVTDAADLIVVTTGTDEVTVPPEMNGLSLREALQVASQRAGRQVITFTPGLVTTLTSALTGPTTNDGVDIVGNPGVVVDGNGGPCWTVSAENVRLLGLDIRNCSGACVSVTSTATQFVTESSSFRGCQTGLDINAAGAVVGPDVTVAGNTATGLRVGASGAVVDGIVAASNSLGILIDFRADGTRLSRCLSYQNTGNGVQVGVNVDSPSILQCTVSNNGGDGLAISPNSKNVTLKNDLFTFNALAGVQAASGVRFTANDHNGHFGNRQTGSQGTAPLLADPLYTDAAVADFTLAPGSPAIDAGDATVMVDVNGPAAGLYFGSAPDLGALETAPPP